MTHNLDTPRTCPICGSRTYEAVEKNITGILGPGGCIRTLYYVCSGCSVMFKDPDKFLIEQKQDMRLYEPMTDFGGLAAEMKDLDPEFSKVADTHAWELF